ncbi:MAG: ABC transporter substrate-binding protein, partial [Bacillota bacterium]
MRRTLAVVLAVMVLVGASVLGAQKKDSIVVGLSSDVNNWHAGWHNGSIEEGLVQNIYETLFMFDENARSVPCLAVSYKNISPLVWEIKLRPNVKFTNGEPFNAHSAKWSLETHRDDPKVTSRSWLASIKEVEVVDELTIRIHTTHPDPELINELTWAGEQMPLKYGKEEYGKKMTTQPVGTGPYK